MFRVGTSVSLTQARGLSQTTEVFCRSLFSLDDLAAKLALPSAPLQARGALLRFMHEVYLFVEEGAQPDYMASLLGQPAMLQLFRALHATVQAFVGQRTAASVRGRALGPKTKHAWFFGNTIYKNVVPFSLFSLK